MYNQSQFADEQSSILFEDEIDFSNIEIPQLTRRNGESNDKQKVHGYIILDQSPQKIYNQEQCPICLDQDQDLSPLQCGHTYCRTDIAKLIGQAVEQIIQCPICRAYQYCPSSKDLYQNQHEFQFIDHTQLETN
ncbi:unnamed protein product (macronuclear) [Paramecium tetraurelia]|uniref:RING-type domain-containing protein n=1 Tax=Paramecium tetraurelia TaxID=5888 RepID=A0BCM9_PARTE|nr:uncharacterized protein GSPATT00004390001 [Paramecium tetraurelia]CAK56296.1 unnamed protein product [Paramecium tetraurelia]|eukprot:XP_001423694.1 hypothetical protein (macronuclear) [Paramecium tetraurelia strain d4-2]